MHQFKTCFQPQTFQPWTFLMGLKSGVKKSGVGMAFNQKIQFIKIDTSNQYCKNQVQIDKVCDIGTYKIFKFDLSKSFVMIFFAWSKVGRLAPESRKVF